MRNPSYLNTPSYSSIPQFTGMPTFANNGYFQAPQNQAVPSNANQNVAVQQFQRRQEQLMASTQRRIQEEAELRRRSRDGENMLGSLQQNASTHLPEPYHHQRASLSANLGSSVHSNDVSASSQRLMSQHTYQPTRDSDPELTPFNYVHDPSQALDHLPYAASLANTVFRFPSSVEMQPRRTSISQLGSNLEPMGAHTERSSYPSESGTKPNDVSTSSVASMPLQHQTTGISSHETHSNNGIVAFNSHHDGLRTDKGNPPDLDDEVASEAFPALDKVFENWDSTDNEWLYSLQTECAKPGAVCECGDSCCCPGCFTHTNNPGDRDVYNTMLNKLGSILEADKEPESSHNKACVPSTSKPSTNSTEAKL
jgi:hypothetical protein